MNRIELTNGFALPPLAEYGGELRRGHTSRLAQDLREDRVELSDFARFLDADSSLTPERLRKIAEVKAAIANGTYETEEKLDRAIERLLSRVQD